MSRIFASLYKFWSGKENAPEWVIPFWVTVLSFCISACMTILTPRSVLGAGFIPGSGWVFWFLLACIIVLSVPIGEVRFTLSWPWYLAPLAILFISGSSIGVVVGVCLFAIVGLLAWAKGSTFRLLASNLYRFSFVWLVALLVDNVYGFIDGHVHQMPLLSWPLVMFLKLFGFEATLRDGGVLYQASSGPQFVVPTLDKLGAEFVFTFMLSMLAVAYMLRYPMKRLLLSLASCLGFSLAWFAMAVLYYGSTGFKDWWDDSFVIFTYLPLIPFAALALGFTRKPAAPRPERRVLVRNAAFASGLVGSILLVVGWFWPYPGSLKPGIILFDESRSNWEWSNEPITTQWFGTRSVYNYSEFYKGLGHYYDVRRNVEEITPRSLQDASVLILKTPTALYSKESIDAIEDFVRKGGGLWLVGDHTDAFGMSTYLNQVAGRFGFVFREDAFAEPHEVRTVFNPGPYAHPAAKDMNTFLYYTGCSILGGWTASDTVSAGRMLMDEPEHVVGTFFGNFKAEMNERVGFSRAAIATPIGRGRLAMWSDSTLFSNFAIHFPGKMETAVATIDWLRRSNAPFDWRILCLVIGGILVAFAGLAEFTCLVGGAWFAVALSVALTTTLRNSCYPTVQERTPFDRVAFLDDALSYHFPMLLTHDQPVSEGYVTAYIAAQRVQKRPWLISTLADALRAPTVVMIHNHFALSDADVSNLIAWVGRGGRLILLDSGALDPSRNRIVREAGITVRPVEAHPGSLPKAHLKAVWLDGKAVDFALGDQPFAATISGAGLPLVRGEHGEILAAEGKIGDGRVYVTTTLTLFSDASLGENSTIPNDEQLVGYRLLFDWYRGALKSEGVK